MQEENLQPEKKYFNRAEWCFQFFDGDVVPFAYSKEDGDKYPLTIEVHPIEGDAVTFTYKGMEFKIFAREMSEESKEKLKNEGKN
jgi:hypothetical protein